MKKFRISSLLLGTFLMPVVSYGAAGFGSADFGEIDAQFAGVVVSDSALFEAIKAQNIDLVNYLLDRGANVNARMEEKEYDWGGAFTHYLSPLVVAIRTGNIDMVRLLLQWGANVNTEGGNVNVPLYEAVKEGQSNIVCLLLEQKGIDVNVPQNVGISYDEYESVGYGGGDYHYQIPETALGNINRVGIGNGPKANDWHAIVRSLREKGTR
ncbi:MAG: ankyrin repeat domain-containing protein [Puniceicoccales bacterium]|jgi:ankyrin repeat protein|nr:ankyrin repeat domain-containing protein [Puniceicoccales bacterium]